MEELRDEQRMHAYKDHEMGPWSMPHCLFVFILVFYLPGIPGRSSSWDDAVCYFTGCISLLGWLSVFY